MKKSKSKDCIINENNYSKQSIQIRYLDTNLSIYLATLINKNIRINLPTTNSDCMIVPCLNRLLTNKNLKPNTKLSFSFTVCVHFGKYAEQNWTVSPAPSNTVLQTKQPILHSELTSTQQLRVHFFDWQMKRVYV